jgi:hypothetical protein
MIQDLQRINGMDRSTLKRFLWEVWFVLLKILNDRR